MRLRRSDLSRPGYTRRPRGRGFAYYDPAGELVTDPQVLGRLRGLVIPPAWRAVWIAPDPAGHIQATGVDAAGRKQYLYHPVWRAQRDEAKFDHILEVAGRLPRLRRRVGQDLAGRGLTRARVLATTARLLDCGLFRVGGDEYASGDDATYGVATLRPEHVRLERGRVVFAYPAKGGIERTHVVGDPDVRKVLQALRRRRAGRDRLLAYWTERRWRDVHSDDVNAYLREASGCEMTAKDFRTWHATVQAARMLAAVGPDGSATRRKRAVAQVMREVSGLLGNTPAVAKASYVDPRVVDLFHDGVVLAAPGRPDEFPPPVDTERAVLRLLSE
ncbi:MAG: DNA topoisomerase IB [Micromonosporaceae bacterium]|jgi:DNA topoisomerase IB|nr:DNA topoisomerase IB [Micromonosporaceae bacterium]